MYICFSKSATTVCNMWSNLRKTGLWRNKKTRLWSDAARSAQRLIRARTFCLIWAPAGNTFITFYTIQKIIYGYKYMEKAYLEKHCSLLHKPGFPGDVTYSMRGNGLLLWTVCAVYGVITSSSIRHCHTLHLLFAFRI